LCYNQADQNWELLSWTSASCILEILSASSI
jgi:hypothetical protein